MRSTKNTKKKTGNLILKGVVAVAIALAIHFFANLWIHLDSLDFNASEWSMYGNAFRFNGTVVLCLSAVSFVFLNLSERVKKSVYNIFYRYRYLIGAIFVITMVLLNINGSSVHYLNNYVPSQWDGVILGKARAWRSDEYAINTPFAFSQAASGFHYYSQVIRAGADAFIIYGQPVWDIGVLFRPFQWGYLILGAERGLSFFWNARLVMLILITFEMGMLLLNEKKNLAFLMSLMISFSPFIQWWFAINGLVEMLVFGFGAVLAFNRYLHTDSYKTRMVCGVIIAYFGCVYVLTFYPAWIVPIAYIMLVLVIWLITENRKASFTRKDIAVALASVCLFVVGLSYVFIKSKETVELSLNTIYPGQRTGTWPLSPLVFFQYPNGLFSTLRTSFAGLVTNEVEGSSFISFFPVGLILFTYNTFSGQKRIDSFSVGMIALSALFAIYCTIDIPDIVDTLTLMRFTTTHRVLPILMLAQLLLLFRGMALAENSMSIFMAASFGLVTAILLAWVNTIIIPGYYTSTMCIIMGLLIFIVCLAALQIGKYPVMLKVFGTCVLAISFVGGVLVNPVQVGARELTDNVATQIARPIVEEDPDAIWVVEQGFPYDNAIIPIGARTINCTNVYPNLKLWRKLDEEGVYEDIYNRYASIGVEIVDEATAASFEQGVSNDQFKVYLNPQSLAEMQVDYILSLRDLTVYDTDSVSFKLVSVNEAYKVFEVITGSPVKCDKPLTDLPLAEFDGPVKYLSLDIFADVLAGENEVYLTPDKEQCYIEGWATDPLAGSVAGAVYIEVGQEVYRAEYGKPRPEVAEAYGGNLSYTNCGFTLTVGAQEIREAGRIVIEVVSADGEYRYKPVSYQVLLTN